MINLIRKIKNTVFDQINWSLANIICFLSAKQQADKNGPILLIPAGNLNGGFGEDIMITSFIDKFRHRPITIFTYKKIVREDFLRDFDNITYLGGFKDRNYINTVKVLKRHSMVYVIGADIIDGTYGYYLSLKRLRSIQLACKLGLMAGISGFSLSKKVLPAIKSELRKTAEYILIKARDIDSYQRMSEFLDKSRLLLTNDMAFLCPDIPNTYESNNQYLEYKNWVHSCKSQNMKIIGVCPNSIQANKVQMDVYVKNFKTLLQNFINTGNYAFVFLYHDLRPLCGVENDMTISRMLFNHFEEQNVFFTDSILNGVALKGYLKDIDFTVTGRMHLGISGLYFNKPMFGISYANKFEGMLRLFRIDPAPCLIDYDKMEQSDIEVKNFVSNLDDFTQNVVRYIDSVKADTIKNFK